METRTIEKTAKTSKTETISDKPVAARENHKQVAKNGTSKKTELILKTHELLKTTSPDNLSARQIAAECNCSATVIYKHFDNLDHLLLLASVGFLEEYIRDVQRIVNSESNALEVLRTTWNSFAWYAFENVDSFLMMFWGKNSHQLGDTIFEYYQLMPAAWQNLDGLFSTVFFNSDIRERDLIMVRRAAVTGFFPVEKAPMIRDIECSMFFGLLNEYKDSYRIPGKSAEGYDRFIVMLEDLYEHYKL